MNIQQRNSAYHFRMQSEREQTLVDSNVARKYVKLVGNKIVMNQRSACMRFINSCHSGFTLVSRDL